MLIDKKYGTWDYSNSTLLDDLSYKLFFDDFKQLYYSPILTQTYFINQYKNIDCGKEFYKKAINILRKEKIEYLNDKQKRG